MVTDPVEIGERERRLLRGAAWSTVAFSVVTAATAVATRAWHLIVLAVYMTVMATGYLRRHPRGG